MIASDAQFDGTHTSGVHMRPTNSGDGVWSNWMEGLKVQPHKGDMACSTGVKNEGRVREHIHRRASCRVCNRLRGGIDTI
jgi:hypothetical protein